MKSTITPEDKDENPFENELKPGTKLLRGQYVIEEFLNNGGFGITYLAKDSLDRLVVIKECFPAAICGRTNSTVRVRSRTQTDAFRTIVELFIEEARNLARLSHPNIVGVHQVFEDNDTAYMAMDFVEGPDLLEILESKKSFEPAAFEKIAIKMLDAVAFIHQEGILHRDIAPDNILLSKDNEPVLIDFGAARTTVTRENSYLGAMRTVKDGYSPQEFYGANSDQGPYSDLYSLAASLYHVMTGELPANAQKRVSAIANGDDDPYVSVKSQVSGFSDPFLSAIDQALQVFPKDRIQSAEEWRAMIAHANVTLLDTGPTLAVDNADAERPNKVRKASISARTVRPTSTQKRKKAESVFADDQVDLSGIAKKGSSKNGLFMGVAAAALVILGAGGFMMFGGSDPAETMQTEAPQSSDQIAAVDTQNSEPLPSSGQTVTTTTTEDFAFFSADGAGDVKVTAPRTGLSPSQTVDPNAPIFSGQSDNEPSAQVAGSGASSTLGTTPFVSTATPQPASLGATDAPGEPFTYETETVVSFAVTGEATDPTIVATSEGPLAEQLRPGLRILSINGFPIGSLDDFQRVIAATTDLTNANTISVAFGIEDPADGSTYVRNTELPVAQRTVLSNGVTLATQLQDDSWVTIVTNGAGDGQSDLQTGDKIVAFMPNNEMVDQEGAFAQLLDREVRRGSDQFNFAIERDGEMWLVTLPSAKSN